VTTFEQNKAAARAVFEVWASGALERLDELVGRDVVHHDPYDPHASDGREGMKKTIAIYREAFPDVQFTIEDQIAEGDTVATRWTSTATHGGELGAAPTGKRVTLTGITIDRFEGGKIVEAWRSWDVLRMLRSIGAIPRRTSRASAATSEGLRQQGAGRPVAATRGDRPPRSPRTPGRRARPADPA
jgi:steroid delta-isomerase-like uncharacterized protein